MVNPAMVRRLSTTQKVNKLVRKASGQLSHKTFIFAILYTWILGFSDLGAS
jgi:hypothetical protein